MNYRLLKQVLKEGLRGIRMCFFSSRRDKYGSIHPSVIVYQPFMGVKENMFLDKGCVVVAGAVCVRTKEYPPYSVIGGNPAHFIKWRFTLEEQIEHGKKVFLDNERLPEEKLRNNYFNFKIKQK